MEMRSRMKYIAIWSSCLLLWGVGCKKKQPPRPDARRLSKSPTARKRVAPRARVATTDAAWKKRGKAAAQAAFGRLAPALMKALKAGGVPNAIPVCKTKAGPLTQAAADQHKVALKRVSHKPRNPANQASKEELALIQRYIQQLKAGKALKPTLRKGKDEVVFYAPIRIPMPTCLRCHGTPGKELKAAHVKLIKKHYPKDQATGFKLGDIRGLWKVTFARKGG